VGTRTGGTRRAAGRRPEHRDEAVDRHVLHGLGDDVALRCIDRENAVATLTYSTLCRLTNRFANALRSLGVDAGDRVFSLLTRGPDVYVTALGAPKNRCVFSPLFPAFGPEPIRERMRLGDARVLVTTARLYRSRVEALRERLRQLRHVLRVDGHAVPGTLPLDHVLAGASEEFRIPPTDPEDPALLHFTSGTTGKPKGAVHVHEAVVAHHATAGFALDLRQGDVFWCTADPGWSPGPPTASSRR
jgi:acetyl-CoA synthetase